MRALLIICLFPFVEFCMGKGRTFCGDGQRLAATFASLAARRACGCRERVGEKACPPLRIRWEDAGRCDGRCSVLRWLMERAALAGAACSVSGCGKLLPPLGVLAARSRRARSPVLMCSQPSLGCACCLASTCLLPCLDAQEGSLHRLWETCLGRLAGEGHHFS